MNRTRGFTLIEVLVALAIVAIGMAAVLGALTSSANTLAYLRDKTFAQWVALNQIATLRLSGQMTPTGNSDGNTDFAGRSWHWRREVTATQVPGVVRI
ncbi:MAG TPA: type II secretion system minor pseudopilin GspI, partial [Steroidobacteraceae bacterium]